MLTIRMIGVTLWVSQSHMSLNSNIFPNCPRHAYEPQQPGTDPHTFRATVEHTI